MLSFLLMTPALGAEQTYQSGTLMGAETAAGPDGNCVTLTVFLDKVVYRAVQCSSLPWKAWAPHEFVENAPVEVRVDKDKLVLKRPNGKEFKARIIKRVQWDGATPPTLRRAGPVPLPAEL